MVVKRFRATSFLLPVAILVAGPPAANATTPPPIVVKLVTADIVLSADGTSTQNAHFEVQANNDASAGRVAQTSIAYEASLESIQIIDAHTLKPDGKVIPVKATAIFDQLPPGLAQAPMISNMRLKVIVFPQFAAGDVAVYTIVKVSKTPLIPGQFWYSDAFPTTVAYDEARETITAPSSFPLLVESRGVDFAKSLSGTNTVYRVHYSAPTPKPQEIVLVSPLDGEPHFFVTSFKSFAELGQAYATITVPKMVPTPAIAALANQITQGVTDRRDQTKAIYEWVSKHIRYVAIELGKGSFVPHDTDDILSNGYGDCKDHVLLLGALLKAKGIESEALLINSENYYSLPQVPTFATLDHVISWVPEFKLYLDSSVGIAPFGVLPLQEYGKPVVRATLSSSGVDRIPAAPLGATTVSTKTETHVDAGGQLVGTTTTTATGPYSIMLRAIGLRIQSLGSEPAAAQQLASLGYAGGTGSFDVGQPSDLTPSYSISSAFVVPAWNDSIKDSHTFFVPGGLRLFGFSGDGAMGPLSPGQLRETEPVVCISSHANEDLSFRLPPHFHFSSVPTDTKVTTPYIQFSAHWTFQDGTLSVHRDFTSATTQAICSVDVRKQNSDALKTILDNYNTVLSLVGD